MKDQDQRKKTAPGNGAHAPNTAGGANGMKKAVALKYMPDKMKAPVIAAKGKGYMADQILQKAHEFGVPVQEDASLVEVLSQLDVDQEIPPELYQLVAEVLSFIYRSDQRARNWREE